MFKNQFLTGNTPVGKIDHIWFRQEEQAAFSHTPTPNMHAVMLTPNVRPCTVQKRGSLHIHAAIWVQPGTERPESICGTVPRDCQTPAELAWRALVLGVCVHQCREGCFWRGSSATL